MYPKACWYAAAWFRQKISEAEFFMNVMKGNECELVDFDECTRARYVLYQNDLESKPKGSQGKLTLSTMSMIDSSVADASFRIARKAAIRTLSSAVDHRSKQVYAHTE